MRSDAHVHVGRCLARAGGRAALDPRPPSARPPTTSSPAPRTSTLLLRCATTHSFLLLLSCRTPLVLLLALGTLLTRGSCRRRADHVASHRRPRLHHRLCRPRLPATFAHPVSAADRPPVPSPSPVSTAHVGRLSIMWGRPTCSLRSWPRSQNRREPLMCRCRVSRAHTQR